MAGLLSKIRLVQVIGALVLLALAVSARAQDTGLGGSFITPYPDNDVYQIQVVGDWLGEGLLGGLGEALSVNPVGAQLGRERYKLSGVMRKRFESELADLERTLSERKSHIVIVMLGVQDRYTLSRRALSSGGTAKWSAEFTQRVDQLIKTLKKDGRAVYWVGLPIMRRWADNERAQIMNKIIRERAYLNGARYIDAYASFIDEGGGYSDYGPDITGKVRRLRYRDGVHFTSAGYRKLAHFVERDLRRDIARARSERSIPLAGDPAEQAKVNPNRARLKTEDENAKSGKKFKPKGRIATPSANGAKEQKAETGKVDIKVVGEGGEERVLTMQIVRPAISAAVVELVTRKRRRDRASQMGDILVDQIPGGLTVMSSIVPPRGSNGGGRRLSPTQTPYFRVFERGERLTPKPGRADDFTWPRPRATAQVRPVVDSPVPIPVPSPR